jgi:TIR domain
MNGPNSLSPREFLRNCEFSPERANARYPNARRLTLGGLFVSHSGIDTKRIDEIICPVVSHRLPADGCFLHSGKSGGASQYAELVQAALHWCDKFMVVISEMSVVNEWVHAEVEWALERSRPILAVRLDHCTWKDMVQVLELPLSTESSRNVQPFDFSEGIDRAQH